MHRLIDFDSHFQGHLSAWFERMQAKYTLERLEPMVPDVYEQWKAKPADWLDGETPQGYFDAMNDPEELVALLLAYMDSAMGAPDLLLDRITEVKETEERLMRVLRAEEGFMPGSDPEAAVILAIRLLDEMQSALPVEFLVQKVASREQEDSVADVAAESLLNMAEAACGLVFEALQHGVAAKGKECFADIVAGCQEDPRVYPFLIEVFAEAEEKGLAASFLGRHGNPEALQTLALAMEAVDLSYYDYMLIREAFEELGGVVDIPRDFSGDELFERLKG